jgi:hypothetical protein
MDGSVCRARKSSFGFWPCVSTEEEGARRASTHTPPPPGKTTTKCGGGSGMVWLPCRTIIFSTTHLSMPQKTQRVRRVFVQGTALAYDAAVRGSDKARHPTGHVPPPGSSSSSSSSHTGTDSATGRRCQGSSHALVWEEGNEWIRVEVSSYS